MRPRLITAENMYRYRGREGIRGRASMRPRLITAENLLIPQTHQPAAFASLQ